MAKVTELGLSSLEIVKFESKANSDWKQLS